MQIIHIQNKVRSGLLCLGISLLKFHSRLHAREGCDLTSSEKVTIAFSTLIFLVYMFKCDNDTIFCLGTTLFLMGHVDVQGATSGSGVVFCTLLRRLMHSTGCVILLLSGISVGQVQAQNCNCPEICVTCSGTLKSLTFRYDGAAAHVSIHELNNELFSGNVTPGTLIAVSGTLPNGMFRGNSLRFEINGQVVHTTATTCAAGLNVNKVLANTFTIIAGVSQAGALCCADGPFVDREPPELVSPFENINAILAADCAIPVTWPTPQFTDCNPVIVTKTHDPGSIFPRGETVVTYVAKDSKGNTASWSFTVSVADKTPPVITKCPADVIVETSSDGATVNWTEPVASDNCSLLVFEASHHSGEIFPVGTTRVTYTATDNSENVAVCKFDVIVAALPVSPDVEVPEVKILTPIITANGDGINDKLVVSHIEVYPDNQVTIVDRWGKQVFHAAGYNNESVVWNGRGNRGEALPTGTYFYFIRIITGAKSILQKGFVELIE